MLKGILTTLALLLMCSFMAKAQWVNEGAWPDATQGQAHGISR